MCTRLSFCNGKTCTEYLNLTEYTLDCITELETKEYFTASSAAASMRDGGELKQLTLSLAEVSIALLCISSSSPCLLRRSCRVIRLAAFTSRHPIWHSIISRSSSLRARTPLQRRLMKRGRGERAEKVGARRCSNLMLELR